MDFTEWIAHQQPDFMQALFQIYSDGVELTFRRPISNREISQFKRYLDTATEPLKPLTKRDAKRDASR